MKTSQVKTRQANPQQMLDVLIEQRNAALNQAAMLQATVSAKEEEIAELRAVLDADDAAGPIAFPDLDPAPEV